ncbi:hypothetical protein M758_5G165700 [Ceratodon purpureus]|uniref:RRM domain-containing protein n=1 Tax=Ceratodon purpureus TaxID=3225 RepID=A0A8T0I540_CERPU|nr:hypothetical protein KC19_5G172500 [Ceratodon purpureus]KAG0617127.1 hypothetical protein M758_5G165700 [Ceratodon purpureus]
MQALVRLARRSSLQNALPSFQQGFVTRAAAQSELAGGDGASAQSEVGAGVVGDVPAPGVAGLPGFAAPVAKMSSSKVYARLSNCPKYAFKSDILAYFEGCNFEPHQVVTIYDEKYRQRFIQLEFDNMEGFRQAQRTIVRQGRLGGRYLKLDLESRRYDEDDIHKIVKPFRGQSLLMMQVPNEANHEDVQRFFEGYNLLSNAVKILTVRKDLPAYVGRKINTSPNSPANFERRALVKFSSPLEAARALRAKHGQFCLNKGIDLRFVQ